MFDLETSRGIDRDALKISNHHIDDIICKEERYEKAQEKRDRGEEEKRQAAEPRQMEGRREEKGVEEKKREEKERKWRRNEKERTFCYCSAAVFFERERWRGNGNFRNRSSIFLTMRKKSYKISIFGRKGSKN